MVIYGQASSTFTLFATLITGRKGKLNDNKVGRNLSLFLQVYFSVFNSQSSNFNQTTDYEYFLNKIKINL